MPHVRRSFCVGLFLWLVVALFIWCPWERLLFAADTSQERFEQIQFGMTLAEVRESLGPGMRFERPQPSEPTFSFVSGDPEFHARQYAENAGNCSMRWENELAVIEIRFHGPLSEPRVSGLCRREFSPEEIAWVRFQQRFAAAFLGLLGLAFVIHGLWTRKPDDRLNSLTTSDKKDGVESPA
jgi:hypothetical protein